MSSDKPSARGRGDTGEASYEVGYRKPPKHTRFHPGRSGNPKGRPKSPCDLTSTLRKVLSETVVITQGDRRRRRTRLAVMLIATIGQAVKGNHKAMAQVILLMRAAKLDVPPPSKKRREGPPSEQEIAETQELLALMNSRPPAELAQMILDAQNEEPDPER
jgi:hypothetical protein